MDTDPRPVPLDTIGAEIAEIDAETASSDGVVMRTMRAVLISTTEAEIAGLEAEAASRDRIVAKAARFRLPFARATHAAASDDAALPSIMKAAMTLREHTYGARIDPSRLGRPDLEKTLVAGARAYVAIHGTAAGK